MPGLSPSEGRQRLLEHAVGKRTPPVSFSLRLFINDMTPAASDVFANYTEMAAVQAYAAKVLTASNFTLSLNATTAEATYAQQTWTFTGGTAVAIYGYFLVDSSDNKIIGAERFSSTFVAQTNGDQLKVTPKISLGG